MPQNVSPFYSLLILLLGLLPGCNQGAPVSVSPDGSQEIHLALNWYMECEHGGFVAADVHGLFHDQGLQVNIIPGSVGAPQQVITELVTGRVLFAVSDADNVVLARSAGAPLVAVLAVMQQSPRCIMVHASSGIERLEDLADVELAISDSRPFALWMQKKLPLKNVRLVPFSGSVGEFLLKPDFAQQAFVFSEPFVAREKGGDPRALMVSATGFNPYASLLVTTEKTIAEQPELVASMVQACRLGWETYLQSPEKTNEVIHAQNADMSMAALAFGARELLPLCRTEDQTGVGAMTLERWSELVSQIEEIGQIQAGRVRPEDCFTTRFLEAQDSN